MVASPVPPLAFALSKIGRRLRMLQARIGPAQGREVSWLHLGPGQKKPVTSLVFLIPKISTELVDVSYPTNILMKMKIKWLIHW